MPHLRHILSQVCRVCLAPNFIIGCMTTDVIYVIKQYKRTCLVQEFPSIDHMLAAWKQDPLGSKEQREEHQQMGYNAPTGPPGRPSGWGEPPAAQSFILLV